MVGMSKKKVLKMATGFYGRGKNCIRIARPRVENALLNAYIGRKLKKRAFRRLWIMRINAGARIYDLKYSSMIFGLSKLNVQLNRKMLAELSAYEPLTFRALTEQVKSLTNATQINSIEKEKRRAQSGQVQTSIVTNYNDGFINFATEQRKTSFAYIRQHYENIRNAQMSHITPATTTQEKS